MTPEIQDHIERPSLRYQHLFRLLMGFAAIAVTMSSQWDGSLNPFLLLFLSFLLVYTLTAHLLINALNKSAIQRLNWISYVDAFVAGTVIAFIEFDPLPSLLFILLLEFNAVVSGGLQRLLPDSICFGLGVAALYLLKEPQWAISGDLHVSAAVLIALGLYFCIYGFYTHKQTRILKQKISELERTQVQLKLRNYRLSKYLSPTLGKAIQSGKDVKLETQRKKLTIFFSDIKGFSELAEEMEADALTALLNNYLTEMSEIALKYGGTIDKFIGDAVMVFFGDPTSRGTKADCVAAVSMAIAMKKRMKELQLRWLNQGIQKPLEIRMGINTGFCTVGNFGTENRLDYTLLGTEVNLASRLESAAEPGEILVTHETYSLVKDQIMCRDKGEIKVKGYQQPVRVYTVVDMRKNLGKEQSYYEHTTEGFSIYLMPTRFATTTKTKLLPRYPASEGSEKRYF
ncbi:MAG: adenylate/guanylate cyclase domain-containing protein [Porticoccaceae bacterium]